MLNRKIPPIIHDVTALSLPAPRLIHLDNGIPVYLLHFQDQAVLKVEVVFKAGRLEENKRLTSRATARLVREGHAGMTGAEVADLFDFYGASFSSPVSLDLSAFMLFTLNKYAKELIPTYASIITAPVFPQVELDNFVRTGISELTVELEKPEVLAYRIITERMFGENHPYGYNSNIQDYQALLREDMLGFSQQWLVPSNCTLMISGHVDDSLINLINTHFGTLSTGIHPTVKSYTPASTKPETVQVPHQGSLQSAIKIGRRLFNRHHPDYNGLFVLNTILGGYFGSRLMTNIREKKGYTYNIYSTIDSLIHDGYFYIATEVNADKKAATLREIFKELKKLREKPVEEAELSMVKSYLLGMMLNSLDGPMNIADAVRTMLTESLPWPAYTAFIETIKNITPEELQVLANRYFQQDDLWVVTVG